MKIKNRIETKKTGRGGHITGTYRPLHLSRNVQKNRLRSLPLAEHASLPCELGGHLVVIYRMDLASTFPDLIITKIKLSYPVVNVKILADKLGNTFWQRNHAGRTPF